MTIDLSKLSPIHGARKKSKRIGTGEGSGHGQTSTRGQKGQRARSGDGKLTGFEGGQNPLLRRVPKRGFRNTDFQTAVEVVNLSEIERVFGGSKDAVTPQALRDKGLLKGRAEVKILGDGELKKGLTIEANAFSASAKEKIEKAGGKAVLIEKKAKKYVREDKKPAAAKK